MKKTTIKNDYLALSFACINTDIASVQNGFTSILQASGDNTWDFVKNGFDLKNIYFPEPKMGGSHFPKYVIWAPKNMEKFSVFSSNYQDGLWRYLKTLTNVINCTCCLVYFSRPGATVSAFRFTFFCNGNITRSVQSIKEDRKWQFFQEGSLMKIEYPKNYQKRKIQDRLSESVIIDYLMNLGWPVKDHDFWSSESHAVYGSKTAWS